jgi:DNA-directed RNA polymerase subunit F
MKKILQQRKKSSEELNFEQEETLKYTTNFSMFTPTKAEKLKEKLSAMELSEYLVNQIIDVAPERVEELLALAPKKETIDEAKAKEIIDLVKKHMSD